MKVLDTLRLPAAIAAARFSAFASRKAGRGGGTSLPGQVARVVYPEILTHLSASLPAGSVVVAGTNGKTTTSRMLAGILTAGGNTVVHNRAGSNLVQGVATAFVLQASIRGRLQGDIAVIETGLGGRLDSTNVIIPELSVITNIGLDHMNLLGDTL